MAKGKAYGVGVGPGDPKLMTLRAVELIKEKVAYKIACAAVPELAEKELVPVYMPMKMDKDEIRRQHKAGAQIIEKYLDEGKNVVYLTLGDSTVYCTFTYLQAIMEEDGYETELVPGITSFCAAAARVNIPLCEWNEPLHIMPALHKLGDDLSLPGNYVLMKSGSHMTEVKEILRASGRDVNVVENCGMPGEKIYRGVDEIPDEAGYFSLIIAKEDERDL